MKGVWQGRVAHWMVMHQHAESCSRMPHIHPYLSFGSPSAQHFHMLGICFDTYIELIDQPLKYLPDLVLCSKTLPAPTKQRGQLRAGVWRHGWKKSGLGETTLWYVWGTQLRTATTSWLKKHHQTDKYMLFSFISNTSKDEIGSWNIPTFISKLLCKNTS